MDRYNNRECHYFVPGFIGPANRLPRTKINNNNNATGKGEDLKKNITGMILFNTVHHSSSFSFTKGPVFILFEQEVYGNALEFI